MGAFSLGREGDRAADLDDQVRHGVAHAGDQLVELRQALGAFAVELAHVQVQHRGAGVVAVHRLLDLGFHADRDVFREVGGNPFGAVRRGGDDKLVLVLGEEGAVEEVHFVSFSAMCRFGKGCASQGFASRAGFVSRCAWRRRPCRARDSGSARTAGGTPRRCPPRSAGRRCPANAAPISAQSSSVRCSRAAGMMTFVSSAMCCIWDDGEARRPPRRIASKPSCGSAS